MGVASRREPAAARAQATLERLRDLGAENAARHLSRRIQFVNLGGALGGVATLGWGMASAAIHFWPLLAINVLAIAGYGAALALNSRRRWRAARHTLFWTATYHMGVACLLLPGARVDAHNWFLMIAAAGYLVPDAEEVFWRRFYAGMGIALYFGLGFNVFGIEPIWPMPAGMVETGVTLLVRLTFVIVSAYLLLMYYKDLAETEALLERSNRQSRELLRNILPAAISARLEAGETAIADANDEVTVLFADLVGFTPLAASMSAAELVDLLDEIFSRFDELAAAHGVEKIKTIGDAYMVAAGVPSNDPGHARRIARFALAIRDEVRALAPRRGLELDLRIGIHSGPVVAGVIGRTKFSYDLWGDAVNTAARMESHAEDGRIQLSAAARERLDGAFELEERGMVPIKGKGEMATWYLVGEAGG